ncbi:MAG: glucosaminidase domain-containing protein [Bacteroidales bacterium]
MILYIKHLLLLFIFLFLGDIANAQLSERYLDYIDKYKDIAIKHQQQYDIPASITLAQGILESGAGNGTLAKKANNHFGIKCHSSWKGDFVYHDDDAKNERFRKYRTVEQSYEDHARFLMKERYKPLFALKITDYKGWAKTLKKCGYATDPKYPEKLISLIERYDLHKYDTGQRVVAKRKKLQADESMEHALIDREVFEEIVQTHTIKRKWGLHCVYAYNGDDIGDIADEFGISSAKLRKFNDYKRWEKVTLKEGDILYLEPKNEVTKSSDDYYIVSKDGITIHNIAQEYGVLLDCLIKLNIESNIVDEISVGITIRLK